MLGDVGVMLVLVEVQDFRNSRFRVTSRMKDNVDVLQRYRLKLLQQDPGLPNDHTVLLT